MDGTDNNDIYPHRDSYTTKAYTYDNADRMTAVSGRNVTWDSNGNMLTKDGVIYQYD